MLFIFTTKRKRWIGQSILLMATLFTVFPAEAQVTCEQVRLTGLEAPLESTFSMAEVSAESESRLGGRYDAILTDNIGGHVAALSRDGRLKEVLAGESQRPIAVSRAGDQYVGFLGPADICWFDKGFHRQGSAITGAAGFQKAADIAQWPRILAVYDYTITQGDRLFGYGYVELSSSTRLYGFFTQRLAPPGKAEASSRAEFIMPFDRHELYILGHPMITSIGSNVFFILQGDFPELYRYNVETREGLDRPLSGLPGEHTPLPVLDTFQLSRVDAFKQVERFDAPIALMSQGNDLLLLRRKPGPRGSTTFTVYRMKAHGFNVEVVAAQPLKTTATHLSPLVTREALLLLEKGPVRADNTQEISTMQVCRLPR